MLHRRHPPRARTPGATWPHVVHVLYSPHKYLILSSGGHLDLSSLIPSRLSLSPPSLHSKQQGEEECRGACASPPRLKLA